MMLYNIDYVVHYDNATNMYVCITYSVPHLDHPHQQLCHIHGNGRRAAGIVLHKHQVTMETARSRTVRMQPFSHPYAGGYHHKCVAVVG